MTRPGRDGGLSRPAAARRSAAPANGAPALAAYLPAFAGRRHTTGLITLTLSGSRISAVTRFDNTALPRFGLPAAGPGAATGSLRDHAHRGIDTNGFS
ncbi:hypothetical protein [Dactylosporangium sp. CA-092794]|uniref:hypothetical protein n=1 Tax=Dactylosporangium sp. CA-092794 TaxID=3239929 RepID=UPI003D918864